MKELTEMGQPLFTELIFIQACTSLICSGGEGNHYSRDKKNDGINLMKFQYERPPFGKSYFLSVLLLFCH